MWERIPSIFKNKYFIISAAFVIWIGFLDRNNLVYTFKNKNDLRKLKEEKGYYIDEIESTKKNLHDLKNNSRTFEKFAREHYLLKREKEEIFLIDEMETAPQPDTAKKITKPKPKVLPDSNTAVKKENKKK